MNIRLTYSSIFVYFDGSILNPNSTYLYFSFSFLVFYFIINQSLIIYILYLSYWGGYRDTHILVQLFFVRLFVPVSVEFSTLCMAHSNFAVRRTGYRRLMRQMLRYADSFSVKTFVCSPVVWRTSPRKKWVISRTTVIVTDKNTWRRAIKQGSHR